MVNLSWSLLAFLPLFASVAVAASAPEEYDYIVVGSGPGGGPLAVNLAKANYSVLLLEAGDASQPTGAGQYPPSVTWDFFVRHYDNDTRNMMHNHLTWKTSSGQYWVGKGSDTPPEGSTFLGVYYPRGGTLGGSSMINAMCTYLPSDSDWNYVVNITGDDSWSADKMRAHFVAIEKNNYLPSGTAGHGFDGWFQTNMPKTISTGGSYGAVMQSVATSLDLDPAKLSSYLARDPNFLDPNRDQTVGIFGLPSHQRPNGQRYSARDYIQEATAAGQYPLTVQVNSLVTRVLFGDATTTGGKPRATGVEIMQGKSIYAADSRSKPGVTGNITTATARKEVIVSGGTFNSPQILMLSGIGPAEDLLKFNISVVSDLKGVGRNMMDNQEMPIVGTTQGSGGGFGAMQGSTMLKTNHAAYDERDMFIMQGQFVFRGFWPDVQTNTQLPRDPAGTYGISMVKNHPQNRAGYVRLKSASPQDTPDINFMLYEEGQDVDMGAMKDTIAWARKVHQGTAAPFGPVASTEPPCEAVAEDGSCGQADEDWIYGQTFGHHPTSTCRIGADDDEMAVLDSKFRVRGVEGLRVVDASAFARIPGVFPVVATFMLSQKATETILEEAARV
ncbi:GMC oxidoreductase [Xylariomycetidae sp. FL2044]|nr:GMC oxidoreductase [Xylariomycetidae sp. FL2044]